MEWTDAMVERLIANWNEGLTHPQNALDLYSEFGGTLKTRNAVAGKLHRLYSQGDKRIVRTIATRCAQPKPSKTDQYTDEQLLMQLKARDERRIYVAAKQLSITTQKAHALVRYIDNDFAKSEAA